MTSLDEAVRCRLVRFWGKPHRVTPRLVEAVFGDGEQLVWLEPLATRPDYYVLRGDSGWSLDSYGDNPLCDQLEDILDAIGEQYGEAVETWDSEAAGRSYTRRNPWPALDMSCGIQWGGYSFPPGGTRVDSIA